MYQVHRYHDISCGHRVVGHEGKCRHLHGHNYRIHFTCEANNLDDVGRVIDFGDINARLCNWLELYWDHKTLLWTQDPLTSILLQDHILLDSIVLVHFNPTAENIAKHLVEVIGPERLEGTNIRLVSCVVEETRKCSASYIIRND